MVAVGAAFDYHAGLLQEPPAGLQQFGLLWLYRLAQEPERLWRLEFWGLRCAAGEGSFRLSGLVWE